MQCNCVRPVFYFGCNVKELLNNKEYWAFALKCMQEAYSVGLAKGIPFSFDDPIEYVTDFAKRLDRQAINAAGF